MIPDQHPADRDAFEWLRKYALETGSPYAAHALKLWHDEAAKAADRLGMLDWAEALICNAVPMPHCTQEEWDSVVRKWRDGKHESATQPIYRG